METITSRENARIKHYLQINANKQDENLFTCEGLRLCCDAAISGIEIVELYVTEKAMQKHTEVASIIEKAAESFIVADNVAEKIADTKTPQGVFIVAKKRSHTPPALHDDRAKYLILSSLQDPGNVGTIIRTAEAFGLDAVILSKDCPDLYNQKVLRASMGGLFRLPVWTSEDTVAEVTKLRKDGFAVFAATLNRNSNLLGNMRFFGKTAVVLGNEGRGLGREIIEACTYSLTIPMNGKAESLGVAMSAAVVAWEMTK